MSLELVQRWLRQLDEALGQLAVAGTAYPPGDLPARLERLTERAVALGIHSGGEQLGRLTDAVEALIPGPDTRTERDRRADQATALLMDLTGWATLFRTRVDLAAASTVDHVPLESRDDLPRYTGRLHIEGAHLEGNRLVIAGRDDQGAPMFAIDLLAALDPDDPTSGPVISRLLQREVRLADLQQGALDFDGHPVASSREGRFLKPAFRSAPVLRPGQTRIRDARSIRVRWEQGVALSDPRIQVGPLLEFNLTKLLIRGDTSLEVHLVEGQRTDRISRADAGDGWCFPTLDARVWTIPEPTLVRWIESDPWAHQAVTARLGELPTGSGFRVQWLNAHLGQVPNPPGPAGPGLAGFDAVWRKVRRGEPLPMELLEERFVAGVQDPAEVCARVLLMARKDEEGATKLLDAHLAALTGDEPTLAWIVFAETQLLLRERFELPLSDAVMRTRWVRQLRAFRAGEPVEDLGDIIALGRWMPWLPTVCEPT